jgi:hypothetical protein
MNVLHFTCLILSETDRATGIFKASVCLEKIIIIIIIGSTAYSGLDRPNYARSENMSTGNFTGYLYTFTSSYKSNFMTSS